MHSRTARVSIAECSLLLVLTQDSRGRDADQALWCQLCGFLTVDAYVILQLTQPQGLPYKFVAAMDSKGFSEAPPAILDALNHLTWAGQDAVRDGSYRPFNELLCLGYMENQSISVSLPPICPAPSNFSAQRLTKSISSTTTTAKKTSDPTSPPSPSVAPQRCNSE